MFDAAFFIYLFYRYLHGITNKYSMNNVSYKIEYLQFLEILKKFQNFCITN